MIKDKESIKKYLILYNNKNKEKLKEYRRQYHIKNRKRILERVKNYTEENKLKVLQYAKQYRDKNRQKLKDKYYIDTNYHKERLRKYYLKNKKEIIKKKVKYNLERLKKYPLVRLIKNMRDRVRFCLKSEKTRKDNSTMFYLGCCKDTLKKHIQSQFKDGMTWENQGKWHLDHIIPFKFYIDNGGITEDSLLKVLNYKNLQPLWAHENLSKNGKY